MRALVCDIFLDIFLENVQRIGLYNSRLLLSNLFKLQNLQLFYLFPLTGIDLSYILFYRYREDGDTMNNTITKRIFSAIILLAFLPAGFTACYSEIAGLQSNTDIAVTPALHIIYEAVEDEDFVEYEPAYEPYQPYEYKPYEYEPYEYEPYQYEPYIPEPKPEPHIFQYDEPVRRPMIALTFDDGPSQYTEYILDVLQRHGARATFCVLGNRVENWADTIRRMDYLGSEVIGHSWNHRNFTNLREDEIKRQILDTSAIIEEILGFPPPPIFRAPYGALNSRVRRVARELGYSFLNWSLDTRDWHYRDAQHLYDFIMERAKDGSIILMHDIRRPTADAMIYVIPALIERGFQLVTATELIEYFEGGLEPGTEFRGIR